MTLSDDGDPFGPPEKPIDVVCIHCEREYRSDEMRQDEEGLWCCKFEDCDGRGFGWDIHRTREQQMRDLEEEERAASDSPRPQPLKPHPSPSRGVGRSRRGSSKQKRRR